MDEQKDMPPANRPPRPPPGGKKPPPLPKGPVPPPNANPIPPMGSAPPPRGAVPPKPGFLPPKPPGALPGGGGAPPPPASGSPHASPPPPKPGGFSFGMLPGGGPAGPGQPPKADPSGTPFSQELSQAESGAAGLEGKIAELEKRLMEEREKVLLATLRAKEEDAVSAKVETSIKDIQDKLRREKREQEIEEARRKAEARALELERRLSEEREAWVSTLKNQLGQRDVITQEMEGHFSTRLKDLEHRWAQEKSVLETALRERDADVARLRQEAALKAEQEKAFWEDRVRSVSVERDKLDRELERASDRFEKDREQLQQERQALRETVGRLEAALKLHEEQKRLERETHTRQSEAALQLAREQGASEKAQLERRLITVEADLQNQSKLFLERTGQLEGMKGHVSSLENQVLQFQSRSVDFLRSDEDVKARLVQVNKDLERAIAERDALKDDVRKLQVELERSVRFLEDVRSDLSKRSNENADLTGTLAQERATRVAMEEKIRDVSAALEREGRRAGELQAAAAQGAEEASRQVAELESRLAHVTQEKEQAISSLRDTLETEQARAVVDVRRLEDEKEQAVSALLGQLEAEKARATSAVRGVEDEKERAMSSFREQLELEKSRTASAVRRVEGEKEQATAALRNQLEAEKTRALSEIRRVEGEAERRLHTLQTRLDWYDANIRREYDLAREKVGEELADLTRQVDEEKRRNAGIPDLEARFEEVRSERDDLLARNTEAGGRINSLSAQLEAEMLRFRQIEERRATLEEEGQRRITQVQGLQSEVSRRNDDVQRVQAKLRERESEIDVLRQRNTMLDEQSAELRQIAQAKSAPVEEVRAALEEKNRELAQAHKALDQVKSLVQDREKQEELFREKEKAFKQILQTRDEELSGMRSQMQVLERRLEDTQARRDEIAEAFKEKMASLSEKSQDRLQEKADALMEHKRRLQELEVRLRDTERVAQETMEKREQEFIALKEKTEQVVGALRQRHDQELEQARAVLRQRHAQELEQAKAAATREAEARVRAALPPPPDPEVIADRVRQQVEADALNRLREQEEQAQSAIAEARQGAEKSTEKMRAENDDLRDELKRARQARAHIEEEAQQLLVQAERHYKRELEKRTAQVRESGPRRGLFSAIGAFLDRPVFEIGGKKKSEDS